MRERRPWSAGRTISLAVLVYLAIAVLAYAPSSPLSSTAVMNCGCADSAQEVWFLAWTSYAVTHLHNPLFTSWMEYPAGANLMSNTSMPLLGFLATPVTLLAGPVASFNLLLRLGFAASATSAFVVLRRVAPWGPAAFLGGLLYGFSPYMAGEGLGHVFLLFVPLPPLILFALERLVRGDAPARWLGASIGLLSALQLYISSEVLVTTAIMGLAGLLIWALARRRHAIDSARRLAVATAWAAVTFIVLGGYGLYMYFHGPQHVAGPPHSTSGLATYHADLLSAIVPTSSELLRPLASVGDRLVGGNITETGAYIGIPLLALLAVFAVRTWREPLVRISTALAGVAYVLALGPRLEIDGTKTPIPLPFAVFNHLPILNGLLSGRFSMYIALFCAVILAVGLDRSRETVVGWRLLALAGIAAACLVPLIPNFPYHEVPAGTPSFFTSSDVDAIPAGSVALIYPYPWTPDNEAQLWQAAAGLRFKITGGEAIVPGPGGKSMPTPALLAPTQVQALFRSAFLGRTHTAAGVMPPEGEATFAAIRAFCRTYGVRTVVVSPLGAHPGTVLRYLIEALKARPDERDGVEVFNLKAGS